MFKEDSARKIAEVRLLVFLVMVLLAFSTLQLTSIDLVHSAASGPQRPVKRRPKKAAKPTQKTPRIDFSQFSHITHVTTQKLACDSCHKFPTKNWKEVRTGDAAFPDVAEFPEHSTCLNCHRPQFFARERPAPIICSNCHIKVTPVDTARYLFPSLGETSSSSKRKVGAKPEFAVLFPHDKHADVVSRNRPAPWSSIRLTPVRFGLRGSSGNQDSDSKNCSVCHQTYQPQGKSDEEFVTKPPKGLSDEAFWLKKGTFKTKPNSHAACFTCHSKESEIPPAPSDCAMCHKFPTPFTKAVEDFDPALAITMGITDPTMLSAWARREVSRFQHEFSSHAELSCTACHSISTMNTGDERTLKVPVQSCGGGGEGCHITASTDDGGILNFAIDERKRNPAVRCTKCHINLGKEPVPESHLKAIEAFKKK